jgi:polygalacturonase
MPKISELTAATSIAGADLVAIVQSGTTKRAPAGYLRGGSTTAAETAANITPTDYSFQPFDVRRYGAVGDGSTDDADAFGAALLAAAQTDGEVYVPAGPSYYRIASALTVPSGVTVRGDGYGSRVVQTTANTAAFNLASTSNATLRDLRISASVSSSSTTYAAVGLTGSTNATVQNCWFDGWANFGVEISSGAGTTTGFRIIGNRFSAWSSPTANSAAVNCYQDANNGEVSGNVILGGATSTSTGMVMGISFIEATGTTGDDFRDIVIANNIIQGLREYGVVVYSTGGKSENVTITGNTIKNVYGSTGNTSSGAGIYLLRPNSVSITGNSLANTNVSTAADSLTPGAIGVNTAVGRVTISGNTIRDPVYDGICIKSGGAASGATITGNTIEAPGKVGLRCINQSNVVISDNSVRTAAATAGILALEVAGVTGTHLSNIVVRGNGLVCTGSAQVAVTFADDLIFSGNVVDCNGASGDAVQIAGCIRASIVGNVITNAGSSGYALYLSAVTNGRVSGNVLECSGHATSELATADSVCTGTFVDESNNLALALNEGTGSNVVRRVTASPSAGHAQVGDRAWDTDAASGATMGWVCTVAGQPGTWTAMPNLA